MQATAIETAPATVRADAATPRADIYAGIHRALRLFMTDTLALVGRLDPADADETNATLAQLEDLLEMCRAHVEHENRFVHAAIEARAPGSSARVAEEHFGHLEHIAALQAEAATLRAAPRAAAAHRMYRHLARFVAANFDHMEVEESAHNQALWAAYSDAEIAAIEHAIVASLPPAEVGLVLHWMAPALPPAERAAWLGGMQAQMPAEAFRGVLEVVRARLDGRSWDKLVRALGLAVPA